jgi:hypothetical protein
MICDQDPDDWPDSMELLMAEIDMPEAEEDDFKEPFDEFPFKKCLGYCSEENSTAKNNQNLFFELDQILIHQDDPSPKLKSFDFDLLGGYWTTGYSANK